METYSIDEMKRDLLDYDFTAKEIAVMSVSEILNEWIALPTII